MSQPFLNPALNNVRMAAHVPRWTIARTLKPQNLATHQYFVTVNAMWLYHTLSIPVNPHSLCVAALFHDCDEIFSGDLPGPAKRMMKCDQTAIKEVTAQNVWGYAPCLFHMEKDPRIKDVIKVADLMDEVQYLLEEERLGNTFAIGYREKSQKRLGMAVKKLCEWNNMVEERAKEVIAAELNKPLQPPILEENGDVAP